MPLSVDLYNGNKKNRFEDHVKPENYHITNDGMF